jgi:hypothetical protein
MLNTILNAVLQLNDEVKVSMLEKQQRELAYRWNGGVRANPVVLPKPTEKEFKLQTVLTAFEGTLMPGLLSHKPAPRRLLSMLFPEPYFFKLNKTKNTCALIGFEPELYLLERTVRQMDGTLVTAREKHVELLALWQGERLDYILYQEMGDHLKKPESNQVL